MIHCPLFVTAWWTDAFEMFANFGGHVAMFADEAGFILPNSVLVTVLRVLSLLISIPNSACNVLYIAHIDMVILQICVLSYSTLLLQYGPQNLGGKDINSRLG